MPYLILTLLLCGCSLRSTYPALGGVAGGAVGSLGGPVGGGVGAGVGVLAGELAKGQGELAEAREQIELLSQGDIEGIIQSKLDHHATGFESFTSNVKRWLMWAAVGLGAYLAIPIFVARKCSRSEAMKNQTRPPFPR
jgi:hypothetical protein